jgi:tetratricopeptide (TPR) repeat protein
VETPFTPGEPLPSQEPARLFTNRERFIEAFMSRIEAGADAEPRVLVFWGVGGIGKTTLVRKLASDLEPPADSGKQKTPLPYAIFDFERAAKGPAVAYDEVLLRFRADLERRFRISFPSFDLCWSVIASHDRGPAPALVQVNPNLKNMFDFVTAIAGMTLDGLAGTVEQLATRFPQFEQAIRRAGGTADVITLRGMPDDVLHDELIRRFALDLRAALPERPGRSCRAVLFFDTFEKFWWGRADSNSTRGQTADRWLRDLVRYCVFMGVLVVICGRDRVRWADDDEAWKPVLEQHLLGGLSEPDAQSFLARSGLGTADDSAALRKAIIACCNTNDDGDEVSCHPLYLALCADIVVNTRRSRGSDPDPSQFTGIPNAEVASKLATRFLLSLDDTRMEMWIEELSLASRLDRKLALDLDEERHHKNGAAGWEHLIRFSFAEADEHGFIRLHDTMRKVLEARLRSKGRSREVHFWYADWYERSAPSIRDCHTADELALQIERYHHLVRAERDNDACALLGDLQNLKLHKWSRFHEALSLRRELARDGASHDDPSGELAARLTLPNLASHFYYQSMPLIRTGAPLQALRVLEVSSKLWEQTAATNTLPAAKATYQIARCRNNEAIAWFNVDHFEQALQGYRAAAALEQSIHPEDGFVYLGNAAEALLRLGRVEEALAELETATALLARSDRRPERKSELLSTFQGLRADAYVMLGRYDDALRELNDAISNATGAGRVWKLASRFSTKAIAELMQGSLGDAVQSVQRAVESSEAARTPKQRSSVQWIFGRVQHEAGQYGDAQAAYRKSLAIAKTIVDAAPDDEERAAADLLSYRAHVYSGLIALRDEPRAGQESLTAGLQRAERILLHTPGHLDAVYTRALAKAALRHDDAIAAYQAALAVCNAPGIRDQARSAWRLIDGADDRILQML